MVAMPVIVTDRMMGAIMYNALTGAVEKINEEKGTNYVVSLSPGMVGRMDIVVYVPFGSSVPVDPFTNILSERKELYKWTSPNNAKGEELKELDIKYQQWFNSREERDSYISSFNDKVLDYMRKVSDE